LSPQISVYGVVSYSLGEQISTPTLRSDTWFADFGIAYHLLDDLTLTLDYQYSRFVSPTPKSNFDRNLITLGATYTF
jgi:long-subunit fatty acid transport protein